MIIKELGLQDANPISILAVKAERENNDNTLDVDQATRYKSSMARANYLVADRPDTQHVCRGLSTHMASPVEGSLNKFERLGRYLEGRQRLVHRCARLRRRRDFTAFTGAHLAGDSAHLVDTLQWVHATLNHGARRRR